MRCDSATSRLPKPAALRQHLCETLCATRGPLSPVMQRRVLSDADACSKLRKPAALGCGSRVTVCTPLRLTPTHPLA